MQVKPPEKPSVEWRYRDADYRDPGALERELRRVADICHQCRRCLPLCPSFPKLFELIDQCEDEALGVEMQGFDEVNELCYHCKLCYNHCPYTPPHEWDVDFPALMRRQQLERAGRKGIPLLRKLTTRTDLLGKVGAALPPLMNFANKNRLSRLLMEKTVGIHRDWVMPSYYHQTVERWFRKRREAQQRLGAGEARAGGAMPGDAQRSASGDAASGGGTAGALQSAQPAQASGAQRSASGDTAASGGTAGALQAARPSQESDAQRSASGDAATPGAASDAAAEPLQPVIFFTTCSVNYSDPITGRSAVMVLEKSGVPVEVVYQRCCGMPFTDTGDLDAARQNAELNIADLLPHVQRGAVVVVPGPSCSLMLKEEYPRLLPESDAARRVAAATRDLMEHLYLLARAKRLNRDFVHSLGKVAYHAPCHLRAQNIGFRSRDLLKLCADEVTLVDACSGVDGTWGMQARFHDASMQVADKMLKRIDEADADHVATDCPLSALRIEEGLGRKALHPVVLLRHAYGISAE